MPDFGIHGQMATKGSVRKIFFFLIVMSLFLLLLTTGTATAERIYFAGYKGGFYIKSEEEGGMELRLGGAFQADYRHYGEEQRADNRFDIRRSRFIFSGQLTKWFRFGLEYEFQGNETSNLVDAYGEAMLSGLHSLRFGQFKEPFSLEWQTRDKGLYFAERSMGYYLTPMRDIGVMQHGSLYQDGLNYAIALFNGDGDDGSTRGSYHDEPEIAARLVIKPFSATSLGWIKSLQIGGSATYAKIDVANVDLKVKSTGMAGSTRNLYVLGHDTKFGVLQDVDERIRGALEMGWTWGPLALQAEYTRLTYAGLRPVTGPVRDATFSSWYASIAYCLTGEDQVLTGGTVNPIHPQRFFNPSEGTFGALCLAARAEHFSGDKTWINEDAYVSVREADAFSIAANWILYPMVRIIADYTYTDFSDPLRVRVNPDGRVDYIKNEKVLTLRFSIDF
jgi:phosphate-selective porin OprO/OprP